MSDDIDLIFQRINDRLDQMERRLQFLKGGYEDIDEDADAIRDEIEDINLNVDELEEELGDVRGIQIDTIIELDSIVNSSGVFIGDRWRLSSSTSNENFFISDDVGGGYYRFTSLGTVLDVDTIF